MEGLWLRWLVAGSSPQSHVFALGLINVGFVVEKVALGQVFLSSSSLSMSFHRRSPYSYIIWGMNNVSVSGSSSET
jgi:hypothetical protein